MHVCIYVCVYVYSLASISVTHRTQSLIIGHPWGKKINTYYLYKYTSNTHHIHTMLTYMIRLMNI